MASTIYLRDGVSNVAWYLHGTAQVEYSGTGTPWDTTSTTPTRIANNDVTGPRFVIAADPGAPVLDGGPPFSSWPGLAMLGRGNRTITIPLSLAATSSDTLTVLVSAFRNFLNRVMASGLGYMVVQYPGTSAAYGSRTMSCEVIHAAFQETDTFWNDEDGTGRMRGVITLLCSVGVGDSDTQIVNMGAITNAVATTAVRPPTPVGDRRGTGQPFSLSLTGGAIATAGVKTLFVAAVRRADANITPISFSLNTSSGVALTATGNVESGSGSRNTAIRWLAEITTPSINLAVRIRVRSTNSGGQVVYTGPWFNGSGFTTIYDLGYLPGSFTGDSLYAELQYRSTGGAATGTLTRLRALEYYTFCRITPPSATATNDGLWIDAGLPSSTMGRRTIPRAVVRSGSTVVQTCEVRGALPNYYDDMELFVAWMNNGTFTSGATITFATATNYPLFETIGMTEQTVP